MWLKTSPNNKNFNAINILLYTLLPLIAENIFLFVYEKEIPTNIAH